MNELTTAGQAEAMFAMARLLADDPGTATRAELMAVAYAAGVIGAAVASLEEHIARADAAYAAGLRDGKAAADAGQAMAAHEGRETVRITLSGSVMHPELDEMIAEAKRFVASLSPAEREAMLREQAASLARGMAPCEHGVRDFEQCPQCRAGSQENSP